MASEVYHITALAQLSSANHAIQSFLTDFLYVTNWEGILEYIDENS